MDAADSLRYGWRRTNRGLVPGGISTSVHSLFRAVVGATILAALLPVSAAHSQELGDEAVVRLVEDAAPIRVPVLSVQEFDEGTTAVPAVTSNGRVSVPESDEGLIVLEAPDTPRQPGSRIGVALPAEAAAGHGTVTESGAVVYSGDSDRVDVVVQPVEDGSVRISTVVNESSAPHAFTYKLSLPGAASLELLGDGSIIIMRGGRHIGGVAAPWAVDAAGRDVATHFEIDEHSFTQVVEPTASATYPIVADPYLGISLISKAVWARDLWQYSPTLKVYPTWYGRYGPAAARWAAWSETLNKTPRSGWPNPDTASMKNQFYCHFDVVRLRAPNKEYWGLDSKIPNRGYWGFVNNSCN